MRERADMQMICPTYYLPHFPVFSDFLTFLYLRHMEPIVVISKPDLKTFYRLSLGIYYRTRQLVSMLIVFTCINVLMFLDNNISIGSELIVIAIMFVLYGILAPIRIWFTSKRNMSNSPTLKNGITYYITSETISGMTIDTSAQTTWAYVTKVVEKDKYFLLFSSPVMFRYLPKDGFVSAADIEAFKEMIRENRVKAYFK